MYDIRSSLSSIMLQKKGICRSQSYENLRGVKGLAAQTASELGKSRKGTPFLRDFKAGETFTLADIEGCGVIRQFFITVTDQQENGPGVLEKLILRMYWEENEEPAVECPLGAFFSCGHGKIVMTDMEPWAAGRKSSSSWDSMPVRAMSNHSPMIIVPARSFHCYFPMPFYRHARITLENCYGAAVTVVAYQVTYTVEERSTNQDYPVFAHFYTKYAEGKWKPEMEEFELSNISIVKDDKKSETGKGTYTGIYLSARQGEKNYFSNPFLKITSLEKQGDIWYEPVSGEELSKGGWSSFRMENPILFEKGLQLSLVPFKDTINNGIDVQSVIYWYI